MVLYLPPSVSMNLMLTECVGRAGGLILFIHDVLIPPSPLLLSP